MLPETFRAMWVEETPPGTFTRRIVERRLADLPPGEVLLQVRFSSLNYKDALSASGNKGVTRQYPHTPGIDAAGVVVESTAPGYDPGDPVLVVADAMGASMPGGFAQYVRVPAAMLTPLPEGLTLRESMIYGTAGYTAALCVERLMWAGVTPQRGDVLVTGASGGVGSFAVGILAKEGFHVVAATGKPGSEAFLKSLGASEVVPREVVDTGEDKPLLTRRWAGVVDSVGGKMLAAAISGCQYEGAVAMCGNAASPDLPLTVFPFILRGVSLLGIDALHTLRTERGRIWQRIASEWKLPDLDRLSKEVPLEGLDQEIERILRGGQTGRVLVNLEID